MESDSGNVLKEQCKECAGRGSVPRHTGEDIQQMGLCPRCYGKGQVYADVDHTITRLTDQAIMRLLGRGGAE